MQHRRDTYESTRNILQMAVDGKQNRGRPKLRSESLDIERVHFRRAILDLEQVAPLVDGGGVPPNVYNRWSVRLESE